jgi:hypothetical protein
MPFHRFDQEWNRRLQTLPADPICGFPKHHQRLSDCLLVDVAARALPRGYRRRSQEPDCVLTVIPGCLGELIQD